jgi:tetratricopeptide (TPR) repeat protein
LIEACWPAGGVGDDSLNRAVKALRDALGSVGSTDVHIETISRTGYRLTIGSLAPEQSSTRSRLVQEATDCWRAGLPRPDLPLANKLFDLLEREGGSAAEWGLLALLLRKAVEYADTTDCAQLVGKCEHAARRAHALDPFETNARVALAGLTPLFGHWAETRSTLLDILDRDAHQTAALHDLAVLEMSTGRPSAAIPIIKRLLASDGLAATYHYKRMYHLWTLGALEEAEQVAGRALALWPEHPAIWLARFWTLVFTGRASSAERMASEAEGAQFLPSQLMQFLKATARSKQSGETSKGRQLQISASLRFASSGPAQAVAALLALCALDAVEEAVEVAFAYYVGRGAALAPLRSNERDPRVTDQHRRVTQALFIPAAHDLRRHARFGTLCDNIGLSAYWERFQITPDFIAEKAASPNRSADLG